MGDARQTEIDLLCGVIDALPAPCALLNRGGQAAYVGSQPCPVKLEEIDFENLEGVKLALENGERHISRTRLEDSAGFCLGELESYPVRTGGAVVGAVVMFRPETPRMGEGAGALPYVSPAMKAVREKIRNLSLFSTPVLFVGEDGVGKSGFARELHAVSTRKDLPFIEADKRSNPDFLYQSAAAPCSLFLRRVDLWPPRLIEALCDIAGVGERRESPKPECRLLASASPELEQKTLEGAFPEQLYKRLRATNIYISPLRDRPEDIVPAAGAMLQRIAFDLGKSISGLSEKARDRLGELELRGNLTELRRILENACRLCPGGELMALHLPGGSHEQALPLRATRSAHAADRIGQLLEAYGDTVEAKKKIARELGIGLSTLYRLLAQNHHAV